MAIPCESCSELQPRITDWVAQFGYDRSTGPPDLPALITFHESLRYLAWRSADPAEGGEYLYECSACGWAWGFVVWTCVNHVDLIDYGGLPDVDRWMNEQQFQGSAEASLNLPPLPPSPS
jgi:hypothetical protein